MKQYEFMLIVDPTITEAERNSSVDAIKKLIETNSWEIKKEDVWWEKKLAYKINKSERWFYFLFEIEFKEASNIKQISQAINLDKNIWRYMFVNKES